MATADAWRGSIKPAVLLEEVGFTAEAVAERILSAEDAQVGG